MLLLKPGQLVVAQVYDNTSVVSMSNVTVWKMEKNIWVGLCRVEYYSWVELLKGKVAMCAKKEEENQIAH